MKFSFFFLLLLPYTIFVISESNYKFCISQTRTIGRSCQAVQKGNSQIVCVPATDSADCALKFQRKEVDFAIFSAEDALLVSKFINDDVRIIGELRNQDWINETFAFQTVVVVKETYIGGFQSLQSSNYCHPGFGDGQFWTDRVLKQFEATVVPHYCNGILTTVEQEITSLAHFFKSACRPGQWSLDDFVDKNLKKNFPSLCSLCDSPGRCAYSEEFQNSHKEALACLTENGGDVTYVSLQHVKEYFGLIPGFRAKAPAEKYKFLCSDATSQSLGKPCTWINQSWPLVVALKEKASLLKSLLPTFLCKTSSCKGTWQEAFTLLLEGFSESFIPYQSDEKTLTEVLKEGRGVSKQWEEDNCSKTIRLCTTDSSEYLKCNWLKQAVISEGIEPKLTCVPSYSMWSCFDLIKKKQADIIGIDTDYSFTAKNVFNLTAIMYQDNTYQGNYVILPIIKANETIKNLTDLKGMRACFPEYNGLAWNSFIKVAKKLKFFPQRCPSIKAVSEIFDSVCTPGANDTNHIDYNISLPTNICSICEKRNTSKDACEANSNHKYYGDYGAFTCLLNNVSDVAFVNYRNLFSKENENLWKKVDKNLYRILCRNGTTIPLIDYSLVNEDCSLGLGVGAEIVSRLSNTKSEKSDIIELLLKIDDRFGELTFRLDNSIQLYGPFNGRSGLIFKDTTVDLVSVYDQNNYYVNNLVELKNVASEKCTEIKSSANFVVVSKLIILTWFIPCFMFLK